MCIRDRFHRAVFAVVIPAVPASGGRHTPDRYLWRLPIPPSPRSRRRGDPSAITVRPASLLDVDVIVRFRLELLKEHNRHPIYGRLREDAGERAKRSVPLRLASGRELSLI